MAAEQPKAGDKFPVIPKIFSADDRVVIAASGPSLRVEDLSYCRGRVKLIAVNDAWRLAPWGNLLYGGDFRWVDYYNGVPGFHGEKWTQDERAAKKYDWNWVKAISENNPGNGLSFNPRWIRTGHNSGYQALNLALLMGAQKIFLLGYDMQKADGGRREYFFDDYPAAINLPSDYQIFINKFREAVDSLEHFNAKVINCTPGSAMDCFPMMSLREALRLR